jgi:outer membrane protein OmpA-like peptidoglycan-associated protein
MMRILIATLLLALTAVKSLGQTVYSDDQVIKISDYITELEKRDSIIKVTLAGIDASLPGEKDAKPKTVNICGKLTGLNKTQFPITDINLLLVKENGEVLSQKTSNNGNFNFQNINPTDNYSFKISAEDTKIIQASKIIILDCNGKTVKIISKNENGFFEYKLLDLEETQLTTEGTGLGGDTDPIVKINTLKANFEKLKADTKACEANVADLQKKFTELEKIFDALKSKPQDMDTDLQLYDGSLLSKYLKFINFKTNDATLDEEAFKSLDALIVQLKKFPKVNFVIYGHADNSGTDVTNVKLSLDRANAVKNYLASKKVDIKRFAIQAMGSAYPIANNEVEEGRAKNRRVEIKATK